MNNLTPASLNLFLSAARDADNWGGTPMLELSTAAKGNLTDLKVKGLVESFEDRGDTFVTFTDAGKALAATYGVELH